MLTMPLKPLPSPIVQVASALVRPRLAMLLEPRQQHGHSTGWFPFTSLPGV